MHKRNRFKCLISLTLAGCLFFSGCSMPAVSKSATPEDFDARMDELFKEDIASNTINLHYTLAHPENFGITDYDVTLGGISADDMKENSKNLQELKKELLRYDTEEFSDSQLLTYDILMDYIENELAAKDLTLYAEFLSPVSGYQAELPVLLAEYTFRTEQDIEDYLTLLTEFDDLFTDIIAFEREKADAGLFMPDYSVDAILEQCEDFTADPEHNYMIEIFDGKIEDFDGLTAEQKESYKEQNRTLITTEVVDAYEILIDGLNELRGSGTNELGLCYYDNGKDYYEYLVRTGAGSDCSIELLKERTSDFMDASLEHIMEAVYEDPTVYDTMFDYAFPITDPEQILIDLNEKFTQNFPEAPAVTYAIKEVHPSMQESMSPAFYLTTPIDDIEHNVIYINPKYMEGDGSMADELYTTLAHEGYPGHLYQNAFSNSSDLPLIRNLFSYSGYSEGWATYVEYAFSYGYGMSDSNLAKAMSWNGAASLAMSAYIDIKIHYDGWDRSDVAEYLAGYGIEDQETVDDVFESIIGDPANYLNYFVGYIEFLHLRAVAKEELGDRLDLKEFHRFLLETGPAPFYIIKKHMNKWMETQKAV